MMLTTIRAESAEARASAYWLSRPARPPPRSSALGLGSDIIAMPSSTPMRHSHPTLAEALRLVIEDAEARGWAP